MSNSEMMVLIVTIGLIIFCSFLLRSAFNYWCFSRADDATIEEKVLKGCLPGEATSKAIGKNIKKERKKALITAVEIFLIVIFFIICIFFINLGAIERIQR